MLVGMLSALMAVSNSLMLTMSGLMTANLYRPLRPGKSEGHYITRSDAWRGYCFSPAAPY